jgi:hypothetical protein
MDYFEVPLLSTAILIHTDTSESYLIRVEKSDEFAWKLVARLKKKFTGAEEDIEDLLTSSFFGVWRYLPPYLGLQQFLATA